MTGLAGCRTAHSGCCRTVRSGLDNLGTVHDRLCGRRLGLLTSSASVDRYLRPAVDILHSQYHLAALYAPEHGIRGHLQAGEPVGTVRDSQTGLVVHSLYGENKDPSARQLQGIDTLVIDLQDLGVRFYTYLSTLGLTLQRCAAAGIPVVVLDRPNPLGGLETEGPLVSPAYRSFVGQYALPVRTGLTIGEFAIWVNRTEQLGCDLTVSRLTGWQRSMYFDQTGLPWVAPSPNIPTLASALVYAGTCLFEGTNLSEGRGTTRPFEMIGAPWLDPDRVMQHVDAAALQGAVLRACWFQPAASKHAGQPCAGLQIHVRDRELYRPWLAGKALLQAIRRTHEDFAFLAPGNPGDPWFIDLLAGSSQMRLEPWLDNPSDDTAAAAAFAADSHFCRRYS